MMAWEQAGVYFPHLAQDQYDMTQRESIAQALPGDLIFFGTPTNVYHVGLYIGNGQMIDAPETGQNVSIQSIYWSNLLGAGRVTG
jgi:cell wall-associated NlpC family hydrolase